jgi:predicted esterase YcpF (UPF0227 family)
MILYLHGFRSSPASAKVRQLADFLARRGQAQALWCHQLPASPRAAIALIEQAIDAAPARPVLIGSSLGGYYATYLAEKHDLRAVLINPAVHAADLLSPYTGVVTNLYTGESFDFTPEHIAELRELWVPELARPQRFWLIVETGDEVLDYREAIARYAGARQTVIEGGDHSLQHFPDLLESIVSFALPDTTQEER